jgi:hypothetical protein
MAAMTTPSTVLRWVALVLAAAAATVLFLPTWADSGWFAIWGLGLPVLVCLAPVLAGSTRFARVVTWTAAGLLLAWALLLGLGVGLFLLPAALAEAAAALSQQRFGYTGV